MAEIPEKDELENGNKSSNVVIFPDFGQEEVCIEKTSVQVDVAEISNGFFIESKRKDLRDDVEKVNDFYELLKTLKKKLGKFDEVNESFEVLLVGLSQWAEDFNNGKCDDEALFSLSELGDRISSFLEKSQNNESVSDIINFVLLTFYKDLDPDWLDCYLDGWEDDLEKYNQREDCEKISIFTNLLDDFLKNEKNENISKLRYYFNSINDRLFVEKEGEEYKNTSDREIVAFEEFKFFIVNFMVRFSELEKDSFDQSDAVEILKSFDLLFDTSFQGEVFGLYEIEGDGVVRVNFKK